MNEWSQNIYPEARRKKSYLSKTKKVSQEKESEEALEEIIYLMVTERSPRSVREERCLK